MTRPAHSVGLRSETAYACTTRRTLSTGETAHLNAAAIARMRMGAQRLWGAGFDAPEDAVSWLTAVQAQEHWYARWSVGQRTRRANAEIVDAAFDDGDILRTHVLRPTWHYVAATDLRWLMQLSGPQVTAANARRHGELGLDATVLNRTNDLIAEAVAHGHLTRRELGQMLERHRIPVDGQRLAYIVMHAELTAVVCSGAMRGKQHAYAPFDERVPPNSGPQVTMPWPISHGGSSAPAVLQRCATSHGGRVCRW